MNKTRVAEAILLGSIIAGMGFFGLVQYVTYVRVPV